MTAAPLKRSTSASPTGLQTPGPVRELEENEASATGSHSDAEVVASSPRAEAPSTCTPKEEDHQSLVEEEDPDSTASAKREDENRSSHSQPPLKIPSQPTSGPDQHSGQTDDGKAPARSEAVEIPSTPTKAQPVQHAHDSPELAPQVQESTVRQEKLVRASSVVSQTEAGEPNDLKSSPASPRCPAAEDSLSQNDAGNRFPNSRDGETEMVMVSPGQENIRESQHVEIDNSLPGGSPTVEVSGPLRESAPAAVLKESNAPSDGDLTGQALSEPSASPKAPPTPKEVSKKDDSDSSGDGLPLLSDRRSKISVAQKIALNAELSVERRAEFKQFLATAWDDPTGSIITERGLDEEIKKVSA